jgi:hypothetical protein
MPMTRKRPSRVSTYVGPPPLAGIAQERCSDLHWFRRADERTRTADLESPATSLLAHVLVCPGIALIHEVFGTCNKAACPLRTSSIAELA